MTAILPWKHSTTKKAKPLGVPDFAKLNNFPSADHISESTNHIAFERMKRCQSDLAYSCNNSLCQKCSWTRQTSLMEKAARAAHDHSLKAIHATFCPESWERKIGKLCTQPIRALAEQVKASVLEVIPHTAHTLVVAGIDLSLNEHSTGTKSLLDARERKRAHTWAPHLHAVIVAEDPYLIAEDMKVMLDCEGNSQDRRFKVRASLCIGRHVAYATKLHPMRRALAQDKRKNQTRKNRELSNKRSTEALQWYAASELLMRIIEIDQLE